MRLIDHTIKDFTALLASSEPAPGGGSTSALMGALGVSLTKMVGALTAGRAKYAEHADFVAELLEKAARIQTDFLAVIDEDTQAYNEVGAVFAMPKETDADKAARGQAMQKALKACVAPPLKMMELSLEASKLARAALGKTNTNAASDLGVAALSLGAAVQGAWLNILINIGGIKDTAFVSEHREKGEDILEKTLLLTDDIYRTIHDSLTGQA
ncbi:MAG: cyclodeaminase/cyclohydrolase family protein [Oscillospiraceae bacterium]|nr:cyclodeaminase/cyclohydrolase family protein [Oscillospiraceae bacterium]